MSTSVILILVVLGVFVAYAVLTPIVMNLGRFLRRAWLMCPERKTYAKVRVNALVAALSAGYGAPELTVRDCTLLKRGEVCDERCLAGAEF